MMLHTKKPTAALTMRIDRSITPLAAICMPIMSSGPNMMAITNSPKPWYPNLSGRPEYPSPSKAPIAVMMIMAVPLYVNMMAAIAVAMSRMMVMAVLSSLIVVFPDARYGDLAMRALIPCCTNSSLVCLDFI